MWGSIMPKPAPSSAQQPLASGQEPDMLAICAALGFDPTNHHNATKCPYCHPGQAPAQRTFSDIQIEAGVRAWFSAARSDLPREQDFANRMRTAIDAASGTKI
jgi:hypothetical protein